MIQLIIFFLNATGKLIGKLVSNRGCLVSFIVFCVVVFLFSAAELRYTDRNYKKHIRNFSKMTYRIIPLLVLGNILP